MSLLDVASQTYGKIWHKVLIVKLNRCLPVQYVQLLKSQIIQRTFRVKLGNEYFEHKTINVGVPEGIGAGTSVLLVIYT